ncbi:TPA: acetyltransferase [Staphylococcus aureus]|nr:acetyltransferase [Staphylococcus aureus]HDP2772768.1 acetyltransferase [Staphylococcus aureus]
MNYETGFQLGVMNAELKEMRKQRDEYKKQRDELIVDIGKLRERNKELEKKSGAWKELRETYLKNYKNHINQDDRNRSMLIEQQYLSFLFAMDCIEGSNHLQEFLDQLEGGA